MKNLWIAIIAGLLFGSGLVISDMANPARVLAFLDVAGAWDYSLALVMGAALIPSALAYRLRLRMAAPLYAARFPEHRQKHPDLRLVSGAALFGIGWGLVGLCPGPALAALTRGATPALVFVAAMVAGMALFRVTLDRSTHASAPR